MAAQQQAAAASVLQSFPFRAAVLALCVALLPLLPAAPEAGAGGPGQAFLAKACELLHLLFVGIAVSYGLFSRKNSADDGRAGVAAAEKDAAAGPEPAKADARYAWRMFRDSIAPFDDEEEEEVLPDSPPGGGGREKMKSWSALHRPEDPVVVVSNGGGGRNGHASNTQAPLSLPVRTLKPQSAQDASAGAGQTPRARPRRGSQDPATGGGRDETVLPSPIPWRSRSGRLDAGRPAAFQGQSQELPEDAGDGRDAVGGHGLEESYGYRAYQSIPRFQYERSVSDPILGGVAVSSDDTESSDDDDVGAYSTRTNSPRESTPEVDENEVDKKAEEFIARFREQIRRQRIESIKKSAGPRGVKHHDK
ncbi:glycoprotein [Panicum miliaceum]|uniref:Glycoprotein n=1 Tax=Panicum miliaceum TaxID=4540 RepID=A0A3L6TYC2_PANMI|nr:glycoprotein [Panicum miliaceum]